MPETFTNWMQEQVPSLLDELGIPGAAVATIENSRTNFLSGFGMANLEEKRPVTTGTRFQLASISKAVTSWGIMKLVEQGQLDLDAQVEQYLTRWKLPPSDFDHDLVTTRRLLSHTAGTSLPGFKGYHPKHPKPTLEQILQGDVPPLDDYQIQYAHDWNGDPDMDLERKPVCVMYPPGEKSIYSGGGFTILELLVEEISGLTFTDYMQREILDPLGMAQSSFAYTQNTHPDFATPYNEQGDALPKYRLAAKAAGGLNSNIEDLARFACAEMIGPEGEPPGRGVISPAAIELLTTPVMFSETIEGLDFHAALGHFVFEVNGAVCVHHTGGNIGWRTIYAVLPEYRAGFCALINSSLGNDLWIQLLKKWAESL
ncbi:MAG: beta-lactamase family protein [Deltaproteobacteria bacterium]|nr:beta-lactamase family protein [Deltaproteobacteria bacterium]